ncbi:other 1 protein kinase [Moniliophthora roreri]|nr:other 1 protein kinase [Moniliophthora roreri]
MSPSVWISIPPSTQEYLSSPASDTTCDEEEDNRRIRPWWPACRNLLKLHGFRLETVGDVKQYYRQTPSVSPSPHFDVYRDLDDDTLCPDAGLPDNLFRGLRTTDGKRVVIKAVTRRSRELDIIRFLSSPSARSHSMNHCIPVLDIIEDDEIAFIVMEQWSSQLIPDGGPCCLRPFLSSMRQCIEHAVFMHAHRVAHLDISLRNLLTDYRGNYAYIDYELSRRFEEPNPLISGGRLGTEVPPECHTDNCYDPFKVDVFALGVLILRACKLTGHCVPELVEIVRPMLRDNPNQRPGMTG